MKGTSLIFRIAYTFAYVFLCLFLAALLLVVPGDFVRQVLKSGSRYVDLIVLAVVFVLTVLIVLFVYALRLYVTRTVLASIPKAWIPIEKGDVPKEVRKMIVTDLSRSAAIAWEAHPKIITPAARLASAREAAARESMAGDGQQRKSFQLLRPKPPATVEEEMGISFPPLRPVWGEIEHDGWGSPNSPDLANLQYSTVLGELPNLIEAKAVSMAPPDPDSVADPPALDLDVVALLQRAPNMTMRDYVTRLITVGVLPRSVKIASEFVDRYERARFGAKPLSNAAFRQLMRLFAELLRSMQPLESASTYDSKRSSSINGDGYPDSYGHIDDDAPRDTTPTTPARSISGSISARSFRSTQSGSSARRTHPHVRTDSNRTSWQRYQTAPTTPRSKLTFGHRNRGDGRNSPSTHGSNRDSLGGSSVSRLRHVYPDSQGSSSSPKSISQASVIRLATRDDRGDLPYVLRVGESF
ncbi:uncharacterized protein GGS25DRAFT_159571 [Hypoxylon fragiforme]|uniref:uncharacterized protein n=1 Tax=Hypoxylon fragiforme TaxID=63214 RepID=UPI0020C67448|nr:uncharacterized protein GGS25DRAFT_159571 [Hypoxylon fragiforme]KAI2610689.1 hypothetical protein GGS25DRAFT_159571 [Hypoxylon fragiforme]